MGRSAKLMKRPTKAEKLSRTTNEPSTSRQQRPRSLSPDIEGPRSAIPLFNTSAKRHAKRLQDSDLMSLDSSAAPSPKGSDKEMASANASEAEMEMSSGEGKAKVPKKKSLKDKLKAAKELVREGEEKSREKLMLGKSNKAKKTGHILGGVDYVKLHESRPGGFKRRLR